MERSGKVVPPSGRTNGRANGDGSPARPSADSRLSGSESPASRILVVEDQDDVRRMLATALEMEGYVVAEAASAAEGLDRLAAARYDLVLTDYAMPGGTGTWMLHEATRRGLMNSTVALVITAHPDVRELEGVEVIPKPLDLDFFLRQVRRLLAGSHRRESGGGDTPPARAGAEDQAACRVELVLYVSSASPASVEARRNLDRLLEGFDASQVKLTICDMILDPQAGEADRIAFTPTLVKRYPEPRIWLLGNLRNTDMLADLLRVCGVDARE